MRRLLTDWLALIILWGLFFIAIEVRGCLSRAAPVPFPRRARPLTRAALVGTWSVHWGSVRAVFILSSDGGYVCKWPGTRYTGSWGLDRQGQLWITESCRPGEPASWQSYAIAIRGTRRDLAGPVVVGAENVSVRLQREQ